MGMDKENVHIHIPLCVIYWYICTYIIQCYKRRQSCYWMNLVDILPKEISKRQILHDLTYMWNRIKVLKSSGYQRLAGGGKYKVLIKGYKLSVIRWIKFEDLMYNMVTTADNTILYNWNLLWEENLKCSHQKLKR